MVVDSANVDSHAISLSPGAKLRLAVPRAFSTRMPAVVTDSPSSSGISITMGVPAADTRVTLVRTPHFRPSTRVRCT